LTNTRRISRTLSIVSFGWTAFFFQNKISPSETYILHFVHKLMGMESENDWIIIWLNCWGKNRLQFYAIQNMVSSRKPLEQIYKRNSRELFSFEIFLSILYLLFLILQWWINRSWISCSPYSFLYYFLLVRYKIIHKPSPCLSC
jgi:hypothetical protein